MTDTNTITIGTEAQIAWASKLVNAEVARIDRMLGPIPAEDERSEAFQRLYGEQIAFVKKVRNTLARRVQSAKWVIDSRNNLFFYTAGLLRKSDAEFATRYDKETAYSIIARVNDGTWKF